MNSKWVKRLKSKSGFTLIELMVSIVLLAILIIMFYSFILTSGSFFNENSVRTDAQAQCRLISAGLKKDISTASFLELKDVPYPTAVNSIIFGNPKYAYFAFNNKFSKRDSSQNITSVFTSSDVDYLKVQFVVVSERVLRVIIKANNYEMVTEIFVQNVDISSDVGATGNVIICESAL